MFNPRNTEWKPDHWTEFKQGRINQETRTGYKTTGKNLGTRDRDTVIGAPEPPVRPKDHEYLKQPSTNRRGQVNGKPTYLQGRDEKSRRE